ncbi:MAG: DUF3467 domain-containing protein [Gemmataceae bacterium]|nr:DUF3467 domain-containing protein [Gemmataceae bacterium]
MSETPTDPPESGSPPPNDPGAFTQEVQHQAVSARVPEKIGRGVFSTGALVLQGPHEFVIDFVLRMAQPQQIVARVILPPSIMPSVIGALRENLNKYQAKFGAPPALPTPPPQAKPPSIAEIYEHLKLPDELLSGVYANGVLISHSAAEFGFDFISNFYPRSAVSCRVFLSAPQVPGLLATFNGAWQQFLAKQRQQGQQPPPSQQ